MWKHIDSIKFLDLFFGCSRCVSRSIVLLQKDLITADHGRVALSQSLVHSFQLFHVQLAIHCSTGRNQLPVHNALNIPPDTEHYFLFESASSNDWSSHLT